MAITYAYAGDIDLQKSKPDEKGFLDVYGIASSPRLDLDEQVCDPDWLKGAVPDWYQWANVRAMHGSVAAGVGKELEHGEGDQWWLKSKVVDKDSIDKVTEGVYKGYSVGIRNAKVIKDAKARGGRIVGGTIVEISLVDRPCNPDAVMSVAKAQGAVLAPVDIAGVVIAKFDEADSDASVVETDDVDDAPEVNETVKTTLVLDGKTIADKAVAPTVRSARIMTPRAHKAALETVAKALAGGFGAEGLLVKSAGVNDESGDIAGAWMAIGQIADLIISEATELKTGRPEEIYDIKTLTDAICSLKWFINAETSQDGKPAGPYQPDTGVSDGTDDDTDSDGPTVDDDGVESEPDYIGRAASASGSGAITKSTDVVESPVVEEITEAVAPADVTAETAAADPLTAEAIQALIDNAVKSAAASFLAATPKKVKGKQAKTATATDASEQVAPNVTKELDAEPPKINDEATVALTKGAMAEIVAKAVTEATVGLKAEIESAKTEIAKVKAMPLPGGPVIMSAPSQQASASNKSVSESERYRLMADQASDPGIAAAYRAKAREAESAKS